MNKKKSVRSQFLNFLGSSSQQGVNCQLLLKKSLDDGQSNDGQVSLQCTTVIPVELLGFKIEPAPTVYAPSCISFGGQ